MSCQRAMGLLPLPVIMALSRAPRWLVGFGEISVNVAAPMSDEEQAADILGKAAPSPVTTVEGTPIVANQVIAATTPTLNFYRSTAAFTPPNFYRSTAPVATVTATVTEIPAWLTWTANALGAVDPSTDTSVQAAAAGF